LQARRASPQPPKKRSQNWPENRLMAFAIFQNAEPDLSSKHRDIDHLLLAFHQSDAKGNPIRPISKIAETIADPR
jgi:hypothetical protein